VLERAVLERAVLERAVFAKINDGVKHSTNTKRANEHLDILSAIVELF
jgi:hypothetical protein